MMHNFIEQVLHSNVKSSIFLFNFFLQMHVHLHMQKISLPINILCLYLNWSVCEYYNRLESGSLHKKNARELEL